MPKARNCTGSRPKPSRLRSCQRNPPRALGRNASPTTRLGESATGWKVATNYTVDVGIRFLAAGSGLVSSAAGCSTSASRIAKRL